MVNAWHKCRTSSIPTPTHCSVPHVYYVDAASYELTCRLASGPEDSNRCQQCRAHAALRHKR